MATAAEVVRTKGSPVRKDAGEAQARHEARPAAAGRPATRTAKAWAGEDRYRMIAEAAYFRAEQRGFVPGSELADWLAAEIEVDDILLAAESAERE